MVNLLLALSTVSAVTAEGSYFRWSSVLDDPVVTVYIVSRGINSAHSETIWFLLISYNSVGGNFCFHKLSLVSMQCGWIWGSMGVEINKWKFSGHYFMNHI